jgi:hypothetical protein
LRGGTSSMTVWQRSNGRWTASLRIDGKRRCATAGTAEEALAMLHEGAETVRLDRRSPEHFWGMVEWSPGCWLWKQSTTTTGYGRYRVSGRNDPAHRVAYEYAVGPIPEGLVLDHLCRNKRCVNPAHLEPVTQHENILRAWGSP